jgi:hypothetical protein
MTVKLQAIKIRGIKSTIRRASIPKLIEQHLICKKLFENQNYSVFIDKYQGFWSQKMTRGGNLPTSSYNLQMAKVNDVLYLFTEQRAGKENTKSSKNL